MERETPALPLDLYRTAIGLLAVIYFGVWNSQWAEISAWDGYLDHDMVRHIFWFTRVGLYQPWMGDGLRYLLFLSGWLGALGVLLGWNPRRCAFWAWLVGTSHFRWHFPLGYLDDSAILLGLFWCTWLPVGQTLQWWRRDWTWQQARQVRVAGGVCRAFVANLTVGYWVTGFSKLASSYWRDGIALYCALQLNIARTHGWWGPESLAWLKYFNYAALVVECGLPLVFLLRVGHPLRYLGFFLALGLHGGIISTIGVTFANATWILSWLIVLREDLALLWGVRCQERLPAQSWATLYSSIVVGCIALSMSEGVPGLGQAFGLGFALQWSLGMSQEYHLFDWIDRFNYVVEDQSTLDGKPLRGVYPGGIRGFLFQSYLLNMRWMRLPRGQQGQWERSLVRRLAQNLAPRVQEGEVVIASRVTRVTPDNLDLHRWWSIEVVRFQVHQGQVVQNL